MNRRGALKTMLATVAGSLLPLPLEAEPYKGHWSYFPLVDAGDGFFYQTTFGTWPEEFPRPDIPFSVPTGYLCTSVWYESEEVRPVIPSGWTWMRTARLVMKLKKVYTPSPS